MQLSSIWPIDRALSGATTPSQSGLGSDGNEGVLHIPQSFSITGTSPSDCLVSYPGHSLVGVLTLCRGAVGVFYSPSRLGFDKYNNDNTLTEVVYINILSRYLHIHKFSWLYHLCLSASCIDEWNCISTIYVCVCVCVNERESNYSVLNMKIIWAYLYISVIE